jgi:hypothetical protein
MLKFENVLKNYFLIKELLVQTYVRGPACGQNALRQAFIWKIEVNKLDEMLAIIKSWIELKKRAH